jgi:hypothetical protein
MAIFGHLQVNIHQTCIYIEEYAYSYAYTYEYDLSDLHIHVDMNVYIDDYSGMLDSKDKHARVYA